MVNAIVDMKSFGQLLAETSEVQAGGNRLVSGSCIAVKRSFRNVESGLPSSSKAP